MGPETRKFSRKTVATLVFVASLFGLITGSFIFINPAIFLFSKFTGFWLWAGLAAWLTIWASHAVMTSAWIRHHRMGPAWSVAWIASSALLVPATNQVMEGSVADKLPAGLVLMLPHIALTLRLMVFHGWRKSLAV